MADLTGFSCVIPSRLQVGEEFTIKVRVLGPVRPIECHGNFNNIKPALHGPFNLNVQRRIQYQDNCLPEWQGKLGIEAGNALQGPAELVFKGKDQRVFPGDTRPIKCFPGYRFTSPGFHFIRLKDKATGVEGWSNPLYVTKEAPAERIFWGDPHWQTFFSDGIRCPEELYAFARDEGFLDFGAVSDHMEGVTDRQWDYFQAVANEYNEPGRFVTLIGQEWTHHDPEFGAPGHRNIYYRTDQGPVLRSTDPRYNTLEKLWQALDQLADLDPIAIPHHSSNKIMGVDWDQGWNPKYEKAVEIFSVWGSSECHAEDGNLKPIRTLGGEVRGRHVVDALKKGFRMGFVGGGDIHSGRPGDALHKASYPPAPGPERISGFTAAFAPTLTRDTIFDAIKEHRTYATSESRIYLDANSPENTSLNIKAASEEGIRKAEVMLNGEVFRELDLPEDKRILEIEDLPVPMKADDFCYVRVTTEQENIAWSSPWWA